MLALRLARPTVVVDVNRVTGLDAISQHGGSLAVGALVRQRALERWAAERVPLLATALGHVGHAPIPPPSCPRCSCVSTARWWRAVRGGRVRSPPAIFFRARS